MKSYMGQPVEEVYLPDPESQGHRLDKYLLMLTRLYIVVLF